MEEPVVLLLEDFFFIVGVGCDSASIFSSTSSSDTPWILVDMGGAWRLGFNIDFVAAGGELLSSRFRDPLPLDSRAVLLELSNSIEAVPDVAMVAVMEGIPDDASWECLM